jgi:muconolactone delta-isomerase
MQYLVNAEWTAELEALMSPELFVRLLDQTVLPSLDQLAQWEEEYKIHGGFFPGERAGAWVFEADSGEELTRTLSSLPFWPQMKWEVKALHSSRGSVETQREVRERLSTVVSQAAQSR